MSADVNLSSDDMRVECLLEEFEQVRVANTSNDLVLNRIAGWVSDEQFLEVAGLDGLARNRVTYDVLKLGQKKNHIHAAGKSSQPKAVATPSRTGLAPGLRSSTCHAVAATSMFRRTLNVCEYMRTERPVLSVGSLKVQGIRGFAIQQSTRPEVLQDGLSHLICHWKSEQGLWFFLHEDPHHSWSQSAKALRTLESVSGARATKTKQFGTFMTTCHPMLRNLNHLLQNPGTLPMSFASSVLRGLRRTLEDVIGATDSAEAGPTVEEECPVHKLAREPEQVSYDEVTGLPLAPQAGGGRHQGRVDVHA